MKQLFLALFLLVNAAPLFAAHESGPPGYIPDYQELVREGYGPRIHEQVDIYRPFIGAHTVAKPTQAYYGRGYVIYYGFTTVTVPAGQTDPIYAFGHPVTYFTQSMSPDQDLTTYTVAVRNNMNMSEDFVAPRHADQSDAVQSVPAKGAKPLPGAKGKAAH